VFVNARRTGRGVPKAVAALSAAEKNQLLD
jgi:hypothetical protein